MTIPDNWRKSSRSTNTNSCVEVAQAPGVAAVRDSKKGNASPVLVFAPAAFAAFIDTVKDGQLDG